MRKLDEPGGPGGPANTSWAVRAGNPRLLAAVIPNGPRERERERERERTQGERGIRLQREGCLSSSALFVVYQPESLFLSDASA